MKLFKLNILRIRVRFIDSRGEMLFYRLLTKTFSVGMHSDVYEWILFKLGMMIYTIVLYIWILI